MTQNPYQAITEDILSQLDKNIVPWYKCWNSSIPLSYATRRPYSALNNLLLHGEGGEYLTFKQAKDAGGNVRKGAHGKPVYFFSIVEVNDKDRNGNKKLDPVTGKPVKVKVPCLRQYSVFSIADCEGVKSKLTERENIIYEIADCEQVVNNYVEKKGVHIEVVRGVDPSYNRETDIVVMPEKGSFDVTLEYYHTLFKQLVRSTAAEGRLDRKSVRGPAEELAAELGASMLLSFTGHDDPGIYDNSAAYINKWKDAISRDSQLIVRASSIAEKAVKYIMDCTAVQPTV